MYQWLVVVHLVGLVVFAVCHGVSAFVAFRIRGSRDRSLVLELLALSQRANQFAYLGLLLLLIGGIGAGAQSGVLTSTWVLATGAVFIAVLVAMFALAAGYYYPLRRRLGEEAPPDGAPLSGDALAVALDSRRPDLLAAIGFGGLVVMIALMVFRPT
jgi:Predicted integral membrane protein (DUF2269)